MVPSENNHLNFLNQQTQPYSMLNSLDTRSKYIGPNLNINFLDQQSNQNVQQWWKKISKNINKMRKDTNLSLLEEEIIKNTEGSQYEFNKDLLCKKVELIHTQIQILTQKFKQFIDNNYDDQKKNDLMNNFTLDNDFREFPMQDPPKIKPMHLLASNTQFKQIFLKIFQKLLIHYLYLKKYLVLISSDNEQEKSKTIQENIVKFQNKIIKNINNNNFEPPPSKKIKTKESD